ncbi:MAG: hypothetical protein KKE42_06525 [Alphaproteobacteria bacterium]|uniref:hypothetical protein n=1 Tax=Brevundimonas sp. TaxID=1871086 RepID=UPI0017BB8C75|nr:hypothetical protein [Brevundimonas sp.]MBU3971071.1 hypothetical protein [Alphaproteobacteria bacterium]MBA3049802.1 hypothetical protein [Brevundimonas sp.]MBU3973437.1 hypothetical protein [Alphaproteobacteria bacterium]MBU4039489.1 hypothetical protein [Alphaproteobacteria bacterium]MBU4138137.1 hypothetical protein [Alphaproteobacteria bacterium]
MTIRSALAAAVVGAVLTLSAASEAGAQDAAQGTREALDSIPALVAEMAVKLQPLADSIGVDISDLMREMEPLMRVAFPTPPESEANWAYSFTFDNTNVVTRGGAAPEGRQTVLSDAQACAALYPLGGPVVHFRRIRRDGLVGHQCIMRTYEDSMGVLISETYAEGADRHMSASYAAAGSVENDADAARALFEPVVDSNIGLAVELADLAVEAAVKAVGAD